MSELAAKTPKPSSPSHNNQGDRQRHSGNASDLFIQPKEGPNTFFAPSNFIQPSRSIQEENTEGTASKGEGTEGQQSNGAKVGLFGERAFFQPQIQPRIPSTPSISKKDEEPAQTPSYTVDSDVSQVEPKQDQAKSQSTPTKDQPAKEKESNPESEESTQEDAVTKTVKKDLESALPDEIENPRGDAEPPKASTKIKETVEKDIDAEVEQNNEIQSPKESLEEPADPEQEQAPEEGAEPKGEEKKSEGNEQGGEGEAEKKSEGKKNKNEKNAAFKGVVSKIKGVSEEQKQHDPADQLSGEAQDAALSPANERKSQAQANVVEGMDAEAKEPKEFKADVFKAKLMKRINEMTLPKNLEEADEFKNNNKLDDVNKAAMGDVKQQKEETVGNIDQATNQQPNPDAVPAKEVTPLRAVPVGEKPKSVNADAAVPDKRPNSEVKKPVEEKTQTLDDAMAENEVTDEQLAQSDEPKFLKALDSKGEAKKNAKTGPAKLRQQEQATLEENAQKAEGTSQEQLQAMNVMRGSAINKVVGGQQQTSTKDTSERERIANEINAIYEKAKTDVNKILDDLDKEVALKFKAASDKAKKAFENYCAAKMAAYKRKRYSGVIGKGRWLKDLFMDLPDEVNQFYVDGKKLFKKVMEAEITKIAEIVARKLNEAKKRVETGKKEVSDFVNKLPTNLRDIGKEAAEDIQDKFDELSEDVDSKQDDLIETLASEYKASLDEVDARIEEMKEANKGLVSKAMDMVKGVIETIKKLKEAISNLLSAISSVIPIIIKAPIKFMKDLFSGIGKGIDSFKANIQKHLMGGLLEWLTGSLGPLGIQMPDDIFSLKGIFSLVMQVLGLGWDYLRLKAVKMMGEPVVSALESGWDMFKTFSKNGVMGMWEYMKDKFGDLKETVMDAIKDMLITKVIEAGIKWLLSLLIPGAGFIKAVMAIKDLIVFFVESAIMLIPAITEAILALAAGSLAGVGKAIEFGLAKLISLVIGLFAKLIGLGGLSKKVTKIFKKLRKRVDRAVNKILKKARKAGRKIMRKLGIGKDGKKADAKKIKEENKKGKPEKLTAKDKAKHKEYGKKIALQLEQDKSKGADNTFPKFFSRKKKEASILENKYQKKLKKGINIDIKINSKNDKSIKYDITIAPNTHRNGGEIVWDKTPVDENPTVEKNKTNFKTVNTTFQNEINHEIQDSNDRGKDTTAIKKKKLIERTINKPKQKEVVKTAKNIAGYEDFLKGIDTKNEPGVYRTRNGKKLKTEKALLTVNGLHSPKWSLDAMKERAQSTSESNVQSRFMSQNDIVRAIQYLAANYEPGDSDTIGYSVGAFILEYDNAADSFTTRNGASQLFFKIYNNGEVHMYPKD